MLLGMVLALMVFAVLAAVRASFLVPFGAVLVTPAAVVGATVQARDLVETRFWTKVLVTRAPVRPGALFPPDDAGRNRC